MNTLKTNGHKIVYIAGLGHSGSTILDLSLGCHPNMIGLGEMTNLIRAKKDQFDDNHFKNILCSCGQDMSTCAFWSTASNVLTNYSSKDTAKRCETVVDHFYDKYGNNTILVDSSKRIDAYLDELNNLADLYIIFLIRDYRSWVYSRHSRHGRNMLFLGYKWLRENIHVKNTLQKKGFNFITIGYEELSLYPEYILNKVCEFIGVPFDPLMLIPENSKSHIIRGNVARGDREKRKRFFYDSRWMSSSRLNLYGPLFYPVILWNVHNVYNNVILGKTKAFGKSQMDHVIFGDRKKESMLSILKED